MFLMRFKYYKCIKVQRYVNMGMVLGEMRRNYHRPSLPLQEMGAQNMESSKEYEVVDLRSDTVTKPSKEMKAAMMSANVGDDVYQEDKSVLELETKMAEITGKEAGLFVASGTMGNLLCILSHCGRRGSEVIVGDKAHIFCDEQANIAQFGGVQSFTVPTLPDGTFDISYVESCLRDHSDFHNPQTELICAENTHGSLGGKVLPLQWTDQLREFASAKDLPLHLDGARIFNASIASGVAVAQLLKPFDSASICFSKSLGAPVGSIIVGSHTFINRARRLRKSLGGGWRQAGYLAAGALYALDHNIQRLAVDHDHATLLANGINSIRSADAFVDEYQVDTNMVLLHLNTDLITPHEFCARLMLVSSDEERNLGRRVIVKSLPNSSSAVCFVTHLDVSQDQIEAALSKLQYVIEEIS